MKHPIRVALTVALGLWAFPAHGADVLTLPLALERATARHPLIRAAEADVEAARAREAQARAIQNPALSLQANEMPLANPGNGNLMAGLSFAVPIGGARGARIELARLEGAIAATEVQEQRLDLIGKVKTAYAQVGHDVERVRVAQAALADAERLVKAAQTRYQTGDIPRTEVFRAEVERNRARRDLMVAESQQALAKKRLGLLVGQDLAVDVAIAPLPVPAIRQLPPIGDLHRLMTASRPELRRAELEIQAADQHRSYAQASVWNGTEVSVAGGLAEGQPAVSTSLSLPLPLNRNQAEISEAEARKRHAEARLEALRLRLGVEFEEAYQAAAIALTRYHLVTDTDLPQARRLADNARRRFIAGEGSGLEAVEALRTMREIETEQLDALLEYREALARLEQTVGTDLAL